MKKLAFRDRIKEIASDQGMDLTEFAKEIGVSYRTLQNYTGGVSPPKVQFYERVCERFGVSANWLLLGITPKYTPISGAERSFPRYEDNAAQGDLVVIRRYDVKASAGHGSAVSAEDETSHYGFKRAWLERRGLSVDSLSVISVAGNSMEPDLYDGDLVLLDHANVSDLGEGNIYAVRFSDALYVKRIQHQPGDKVLLISKNKDYPPIEVAHPVADGVEVIGRIVASMHEW